MLFSSKEIMAEVSRREKEAKVVPDPEVDTYMKVHHRTNFPFRVQKLSINASLQQKQSELDLCNT